MGEGEVIEVDLPVVDADEPPPVDEPVVVELTVPDDTIGGSEILAEHDGLQFCVVVPDSLMPGDVFAVEVPSQAREGEDVPGQEIPERLSLVAGTERLSLAHAVGVEGSTMSNRMSLTSQQPATSNRRRRRKSSGFESWASFPFLTNGVFDIRQAVEVYRNDGTWSTASIEAYDEMGDTYDVLLEDGRVKYLVESNYLRHIKVGGFNKHQAVKVLEHQAWVWARIDDYVEDESSMYGSYSVELLDGQKRYYLESSDMRQVQRPALNAGG